MQYSSSECSTQARTTQRRAAAQGGLSPIADSCNHIYEDAELCRASKSYSCSLRRQCRGVLPPLRARSTTTLPAYYPTTNPPMLTSRILSFFMRKSSASCTFSIFCA